MNDEQAPAPVDLDGAVPAVELQEFLVHLAPIVDAFGGAIVPVSDADPADTPIIWRGTLVGYVQGSELHGALDRLVGVVEREAGCSLEEMNRSQKQTAVRRLDELGAFLLRGAVEDIAHLMGVSRVTLYSYLNAIRPKD
ncbi:MAG: helix-turn-helix domain-containing protein [Acidimicrobiia bacterium]|nr:helix-turn-helix domain-containing protein [Acidimicrobiia bacterium]